MQIRVLSKYMDNCNREIYSVEFKPSRILRFLRCKTDVMCFQKLDTVYKNYVDFNAVVSKDGEILPFDHEVVSKINSYDRRF